MSVLYEGLSSKTKLGIIITSASVAVINLCFAWYIASQALKEIPMSEVDINEIKLLSSDLDDKLIYANNLNLRVHAINAQVHLKGITNKQTIIIVSIGSGFAFMAIGFALFLIGADGALQVKQIATDSKLMITATAPGIACFLFAAALIGFGVSREYTLEIGDIAFLSTVGIPQEAQSTGNTDFPDP